jgi:hypothetical protein
MIDVLMRDEWPCYYILVGRTPMAVDMTTWAMSFESIPKRKVARTRVAPKCEVSTVFLGLDHNSGGGEPILFETIVFGGPLDGHSMRYHTYDQAEAGHAATVIEARKACEQIAALRRAARGSRGWRRHVRARKAMERAQ